MPDTISNYSDAWVELVYDFSRLWKFVGLYILLHVAFLFDLEVCFYLVFLDGNGLLGCSGVFSNKIWFLFNAGLFFLTMWIGIVTFVISWKLQTELWQWSKFERIQPIHIFALARACLFVSFYWGGGVHAMSSRNFYCYVAWNVSPLPQMGAVVLYLHLFYWLSCTWWNKYLSDPQFYRYPGLDSFS